MNELIHLFNFNWSVLRNQISPKHVHNTSVSRSIFFALKAQIVLNLSPYLATSSLIICHTKILPIGANYLQKPDMCSPKQNCTLITGGHFIWMQPKPPTDMLFGHALLRRKSIVGSVINSFSEVKLISSL